MKLIIDNRESSLDNTCRIMNERFKGISITTDVLPLGDIILEDDSGNEIAMFERKTLADLASSIKDGRYNEQSHRLHNSSFNNHNIIYIIEGDLRYITYSKYIKAPVIYSSMVSILYYKGFSLYRTISLKETAEFLLRFASKVGKELSMGVKGKTAFYDSCVNNIDKDLSNTNNTNTNNTNTIKDAEKYSECYVNKRIKKNNITTDNISEIMLSQIPNVSVAYARAIISRYGSIPNLITALSEKGIEALDEIKVQSTSGKWRRISQICKENIITYLLYDKGHEIPVIDTTKLNVVLK